MIIKTFAKAIFLFTFITSTAGTVCLTCSGTNERECNLNGYFEECESEEVCATTVRRNIFQRQITKRCQQIDACLNEQKQNWNRIDNDNYVCNRNRRESTCRCCCFSNRCNRDERCPGLTTTRQESRRCPQLVEHFPNGRRRCSNSNRVGSVCIFRCSNKYQVIPRYSQQIICQPNGKWDKPQPCCSEPCPPNVFIDMVILRGYRDHRLLLQTTRVQVANFLRHFILGPNSLRVTRLHFDSFIHTPFLSFRETANLTAEEIANFAAQENIDVDTNVTELNTGAALRYVQENVFNTEFDRPNARNVLLLFLDSASSDEVAASARRLRESGVTIFASFVKGRPTTQPSEEELYEITGFRNRHSTIIPSIEKTPANEKFWWNYCPDSCNK